MPPVIEREAMERVARYRELAAADGAVIAEAPVPDGADGWFCPATVVADLPDDSPVLAEEIFGPLLAVQRVRGVEHACDIVDGLSFALTGGLFSRDPRTSAACASGRRSATCTSTAGSPARWSDVSRSAATACREPA